MGWMFVISLWCVVPDPCRDCFFHLSKNEVFIFIGIEALFFIHIVATTHSNPDYYPQCFICSSYSPFYCFSYLSSVFFPNPHSFGPVAQSPTFLLFIWIILSSIHSFLPKLSTDFWAHHFLFCIFPEAPDGQITSTDVHEFHCIWSQFIKLSGTGLIEYLSNLMKNCLIALETARCSWNWP